MFKPFPFSLNFVLGRTLLVLLLITSNILASAITNSSNFVSCMSSVINNEKSDTKKLESQQLLTLINQEIQSLSGKNPWSSNSTAKLSETKLNYLLYDVRRKIGIKPVSALLLDTKEDDYVRQAAYKVIMIDNGYTINDLPALCDSFVFSSESPKVLHSSRRHWIKPKVYRAKVSPIIASILGINNLPIDNSPISLTMAIKYPNKWLREILEKALVSSKEESELTLIRQCLEKCNKEEHVLVSGSRRIAVNADRHLPDAVLLHSIN